MLEFYTDGSCLGNGGEDNVGGWAWAMYEDGNFIMTQAGAAHNTTNNRMELTAMIEALGYITSSDYINDTIIIYSDSSYIINCYNQKWYKSWEKNGWKNSKKQPVKNPDLWRILIPFFERENITFEKVKGHNGVKGNEVVNNLAVSAARRLKGGK